MFLKFFHTKTAPYIGAVLHAVEKLQKTVFSEAYRSLSVGRESSLLVTSFLRGLSNPLVPPESSERFSKYLDRSLSFECRIATTIF